MKEDRVWILSIAVVFASLFLFLLSFSGSAEALGHQPGECVQEPCDGDSCGLICSNRDYTDDGCEGYREWCVQESDQQIDCPPWNTVVKITCSDETTPEPEYYCDFRDCGGTIDADSLSGPTSVNLGEAGTYTADFSWSGMEDYTNDAYSTGNTVYVSVAFKITIFDPSGSVAKTCGPYTNTLSSGTASMEPPVSGCTINFTETGSWTVESRISVELDGENSGVDTSPTDGNNVKSMTVNVCNSAGSSCTQNSDCCSDMCEYKEDTDSYECIDSCSGNFAWDGGTPTGNCDPLFPVCYDSSDVSGSECQDWPELSSPWFANRPGCVDTSVPEACCYEATNDGVEYGQDTGITRY